MMMRRIFAINIVIFIGFKYVVLLMMITAYVSRVVLPFQAMVNGLVWFFHILPAWLVWDIEVGHLAGKPVIHHAQ